MSQPWLATSDLCFFSTLRENIRCDVCVVGAGITGATTAYLLAAEGLKVVLIDQGAVGSGETGRTTAHLTSMIDRGYEAIEQTHGEKTARLVADSHMAALKKIKWLVKNLEMECEYEQLDAYLFLKPQESPKLLDKSFEAARKAGIREIEKVRRIPVSFFDSGPALRIFAQAQFHPLKYLNALLFAFQGLGGRICTKTRMCSLEGKEGLRIVTGNGSTIDAGSVVVATDSPVNDRVVIHTKQAAYRTYAIGARIKKGLVPRALYWDKGSSGREPYHYVRVYNDLVNGSDILIIGGEDHKVGQADDGDERYQHLLEWGMQRFPMIEAVSYRWSGQVMEPADGLAFIGRNPMQKAPVYVATGFSGNGMTYGTISGLLIADLVMGRKNPWEEIYDPARKMLRSSYTFVKENLNAVVQYGDWLTPGQMSALEELPPDSGAVVRKGLTKIAVYRDKSAQLHACSAVCPHLGGIVGWNPVEKSWDCPCHGSRFDPYGKAIHGPTIQDLSVKKEDSKPEEESLVQGGVL